MTFPGKGQDIEIAGLCGHKNLLDRGAIPELFCRKHWPTGIEVAVDRFRCSRCGRRATRISPMDHS